MGSLVIDLNAVRITKGYGWFKGILKQKQKILILLLFSKRLNSHERGNTVVNKNGSIFLPVSRRNTIQIFKFSLHTVEHSPRHVSKSIDGGMRQLCMKVKCATIDSISTIYDYSLCDVGISSLKMYWTIKSFHTGHWTAIKWYQLFPIMTLSWIWTSDS